MSQAYHYMVLRPFSVFNPSRYFVVVRNEDLPDMPLGIQVGDERFRAYGKFLAERFAYAKCDSLNRNPSNRRLPDGEPHA